MAAILTAEFVLGPGTVPASIVNDYAKGATLPREEVQALTRLMGRITSGEEPARVRVCVDSSLGVAATLSMAATQANITAGEYIGIIVPGFPAFRLVCVASNADVTLGQFVSATDNNTVATNIRAAINGMLGLKDLVVASGATNNVVVTSKVAGSLGNSIVVVDGTVNGLSPAGGNLATGVDPSARATATITITHANVTNGDTTTIGTKVITAATAAANENQWTIASDATTDAAALAACINANSALRGIVTATSNLGVVTLTYQISPRVAVLTTLATNDGTAFALVQPATTLTLANTQPMVTYDLGVA